MLYDIIVALSYPIVFIYGYYVLKKEYKEKGEVGILSIFIFLLCLIIAPAIMLFVIAGCIFVYGMAAAINLKITKSGTKWAKKD